ncbi:MAG: carboxypeptidase-like regulatory domain-containing protein [Thermoanaerobaculia bacterium]
MNRVSILCGGAMLVATAAAAAVAVEPIGNGWVQNDDGIVQPEGAQPVIAHSGETVHLRILSAATAAPIRGALVWWVSSDTGTPLLTRSNLATDEKGLVRVPLVPHFRLRIWAKGHEVVERDSVEVGSIHDLTLWPGGPVSLRLAGAKEPVSFRYFLGTRTATRELAATTDASGRVVFPGTPRSGIRVEVVDSRFAVAGVTLFAGDDRELVLQPSHELVAHLVDVAGRPVPHVRAHAFLPISSAPGDVRRLDWTGDDDGVIALTSLPAGEHVVEFAADGFATRSLRLLAGSRKDAGEVRLRPGVPFVVVVRGDHGPLEQATVTLENGERLLTDGSGRVTIPGVDFRQQPQLEIAATDYLPATIYVRPEMKSPYEVSLRSGSGFRLRLLDGSTGEAVERARVRVRTPSGWSDRDLHGDAGEYVVGGFGSGRMQLRIAAPGYLPITTSAFSSDGTAELGAFFLSRGAVVTGSLLDLRSGKPLAGARIETVPRGPMGTLAARLFGDAIDTTTDAAGKFTLSGLEGGLLCATVSHPAVGTVPVSLGRIDEDSFRDAGVISLGETGSLAGTVRDSTGSPVAHANVELRFGPVFSPCMALTAIADGQGQYQFDRVAPGPYHLLALHGHEVLGSRGVLVRNDERTREDLEIRMVAVHGAIVLRGLPAGGGGVVLKRAGRDDFTPPTIFFRYIGAGVDARQRPVTDIVGKASFSVGSYGTFDGKARLDPGEYEVIWTPPDNSAWYHESVELGPDATTLELPLHFDGVPLSGRAVTADGLPAAGAYVRLIDASGHVRRTTFATDDGAFLVPQVPPGRWTVDAAAKGASGLQTVDVDSTPPDVLNLILVPAPVARLVVHIDADPEAAPIEAVVVTKASGLVRIARNAPDATFEGLPPGTYALFAVDRHGGIIAGPNVTTGAATTRATLAAGPTHSLRIRCDETEPGRRVLLSREGHSLAALLAYVGVTLSVLDDGTVALPPLSEGTWSIRVGNRTEEIEVARDETIDL